MLAMNKSCVKPAIPPRMSALSQRFVRSTARLARRRGELACTLRVVPLLSLALVALGTVAQTGCSSGGGGDIYDDGIVRDSPEPVSGR